MGSRELFLWIGMGCILLFMVVLSIMFTSKKQTQVDLETLINGSTPITNKRKTNLKEQVNESGIYKEKYKKLKDLLERAYDINNTPESVMQFEFVALCSGIMITLLVWIVFDFLLLTILAIGLTIYAVMMKELDLSSKVKAKDESFDNLLPQFETNLLLGMQAGANLQKSMEMAIKTLPEGLVQVEFKKLLLDTKMYTEDVSKAYANLYKRIPTKDCERFCNIVIAGLRNGNSMTDILEGESEYMSQEILNKIKEKGEKNSVKATAISSGLVFMPLLVIFLAPIMASSM